MLAGLASLHCGGGGGEGSATTTARANTGARPAATSEPQIELVKVEITELRPTTDLIVELVGGQVRLISPNHTGQRLDFGRRAPDNEHLRVELLAEAKERLADAVERSERREVRVRLDAATVASDLIDLFYTMGQIGVLGYQLEIATSEGPHVLTLNMPQTCYGELSSRRCVNVHLQVTEQGTLVSAMVMDPVTWCDLAPEDSENLASISGRAITPDGGGCPGWPVFGPGDDGLDQVLAKLGEFGSLCRTTEISVDGTVTAATFIPTIAALRAAKQHVVFRAGGRASCAAGPLAPISLLDL
jgi:hypothetical protein